MTGSIASQDESKPTGFIIPAPFRNSQVYVVSTKGLKHGKPLLLRLSFHLALILCGLGIVSLGIILFCLPLDFPSHRSKLRVKIQRVFIPN